MVGVVVEEGGGRQQAPEGLGQGLVVEEREDGAEVVCEAVLDVVVELEVRLWL